jgi:hypothetical protein
MATVTMAGRDASDVTMQTAHDRRRCQLKFIVTIQAIDSHQCRQDSAVSNAGKKCQPLVNSEPRRLLTKLQIDEVTSQHRGTFIAECG